ncbi:pilin [Moritella dasanensis]|uniref:pilin n=1 Tax=Moritella dasanensis TaxID=428031 RepID=UPI0002E74714|nr:prepilin-type N-terminal cleavage/methylation domain-containing protein [Moritella dasanensis]
MRVQQKALQQGFTLIELMIVVAIVAILAGVGMPAYQNYSKRAEFAEVIAATGPIKTAVELCAQMQGLTDDASNTFKANDASKCGKAGEKGIPADDGTGYGKVDSTAYAVTASGATITATATGDDSVDYTLTAKMDSSGRVGWVQGGSCSAKGFC